jgi:preprotein translocase subunit SecG
VEVTVNVVVVVVIVIIIIIIIIITRQQLGLNRPVSASSNSLFKDQVVWVYLVHDSALFLASR